ncbi:hypothetical protein LCI18_013819 [Fusarium solani-melongenae]|uniref:Uncharacterized protein n=1 Tax=Fusarium solani subsp. cucurbitae TaxID=2747967 RepID=A0ACD3ZNI5_FUSSC|nr:hypothetical protein LCI18_013819 [Fusarium solani-melongenae]
MSRPYDWVERLKPAGPDGPSSLAAERAGSQVDTESLANHVLGPQYLERQQRVLDILLKDKIFSKQAIPNLSRPDRYLLGLARGKRMRQLQDKYGWDDDEHEMAKFLVDEISPYQLNVTMFRQTLREQTNDAQRANWLKRCEDWDIVGAYAQTELGHGSNVQGIETTATWDQATKEFILHSPSLTAAKWWNGTLGRTANHAVVIAQMMLPDPATGGKQYKSFGPHAFIVQIRDMKTHQPLDGVVVGDIGPKYGYASMDNAYMLLDNIRVPHDQLLSRYSSVDSETGAYHAPENRAVVYGSLTHARKRIVMAARMILARSTTVAIRYCAVRRQFMEKGKGSESPENAVLDYPTVQIRLFPLLATAFALHYSGKKMGEIYDRTRSDIENKGDLSALADLHSLSSGLKSLSTELAAGGIETCRRSMGGHGYGGGSGLVGLNADYLSKPTVEGDNWMITQQMARYLIKKAKLVATSPNHKPENRTEEALSRYWQRNPGSPQTPRTAKPLNLLNNNEDLVEAFEQRAAFLAFKAYEAIESRKASWNSVLPELTLYISTAQSEAILVYNFFDGLDSDTELPHATKEVMWQLFRLFGLYTINKSSREFARSGAIPNEQLDRIADAAIENIMEGIRPHAVKLVDSWKFPDYLLDSALGRYDGRVYEDLFNRAHRLNPLNKIIINPDYRNDEIVHGSGDAGKILAKL